MSEYRLTPQAVADLRVTRRHDLLVQGGHSCPPPLRLGLIVGRSVLIPANFRQGKKRTRVSALP